MPISTGPFPVLAIHGTADGMIRCRRQEDILFSPFAEVIARCALWMPAPGAKPSRSNGASTTTTHPDRTAARSLCAWSRASVGRRLAGAVRRPLLHPNPATSTLRA